MRHTQQSGRQGGAVIIVVIALLASLMFLGIVFYEFSSQEKFAAEAGARSRERDDQVQLPYTAIADEALRQLIVGAPESARNSALWQHDSMVQDMLGRFAPDGSLADTSLHSGRGIRVWTIADHDGDGYPDAETPADIQFDFYGDGTLILDGTNFVLNLSPSANDGWPNGAFDPGLVGLELDYSRFREIHQGYTYPDINTPWLAVDTYVGGQRVIKPSFFLPQYFPDYRLSGTFAGLHTNPDHRRQVFRPHQAHVAAGTPGIPRFLNSVTPAQSGNTSRLLAPFPFEVDANNNGTPGEMGVWTLSDFYDLDVDVNGDGMPDAIRIDIDFPIINLPGGRQVVPLIGFKVEELDGLFNLNAHGNPAAWNELSNNGSLDPYANIYGLPVLGSLSNRGASPSEINLLVGLGGDPVGEGFAGVDLARATLPHRGMYFPLSGDAGLTFDRVQMANTEFAMLLYGGYEYYPDLSLLHPDPLSHTAGRCGERGLLANLLGGGGVAPSPGILTQDDDGDDNDPGNNGPYASIEFQDGGDGGRPLPANGGTRPVDVPPVVHPLDLRGTIEDLTGGPTGAMTTLAGSGTNPMVWKRYGGAPQWQGNATVQGVTPYNQAVTPGLLQPVTVYDGLFNEPDETILEYNLRDYANDAVFEPEELAALHLSDADWARYGRTSRLRQLLPFNFEWSQEAAFIRRQYTTESWDRLEFSQPLFEIDSDGDGNIDISRFWEFSDPEDIDGDGNPDEVRFPPLFPAVGSSRHEYGLIEPNDPFRPEIRRLLTVRRYLSGVGFPDRHSFPQHRLDINRILADDTAVGGPTAPDLTTGAFDSYGNPLYRHLIPHPVEGTGAGQLAPGNTVPAMVHLHGDPLPFQWNEIVGNPVAQEWWARYDRQRLARDIYVLLYVLSAPDGFDPTAAPYSTGDANGNGIDDHVERIAQFAVNLVDQMDRDSVITRFEYDPDLSTGWTNPSAVAYGVEHQQLVFSEVMYLQNEINTGNLSSTLHDDRDDTHRWLYVELRNASPFPVELREETWRLVRTTTGTDVIEAVVEFGNGNSFRTVGPGENFLLACHDGMVVNANGEILCSDFYADVEGAGELEAIYPHNGGTVADHQADPAPSTDIDLCDELRGTPSGHSSFYRITQPYPGGHAFVAPIPGGGATPDQFDLVLQRGRKTAGGVEWIEVDRFYVDSTEYGGAFAPSGDNQAANIAALENLTSRGRRQPFDERVDNHLPGSEIRNHTLDPRPANKHLANGWWRVNVGPAAQFTLYQPHYDRDYSSVMELLSLPLYGPARLVADQYTNTTPPRLDINESAGLWFMNSDGIGPDPISPLLVPNRWYRLLEFLQIHPRTNDALAARLQYLRRTYGRLNLNMIRHPHVLAGLIDDRYHLDVADAANPTFDLIDGANRDWYEWLLVSRDGLDHLTGLPLPGLPQARPFRSFSSINPVAPDQSAGDTLLRNTPAAVTDPNLQHFNLFEARSMNDIELLGGNNDVDYATRNRILGKVHNLTTNRSHLFVVWLSIEYFEAHQIDGNGDGIPETTQIGGKAEDLPMRRLFCVVDRSRLEEAYDPATGRFDFRQFIIYRRWID